MNTKTLTIITIAFFAACASTRDNKNAPSVSATNDKQAWLAPTNTGPNMGATNADTDTKANADTDTGLNSGAYSGNNTDMNNGSATANNTATNERSAYTPGKPYVQGDLTITPIYEDSMMIEVGKKKIYVNPRANAENKTKADYVLFTITPDENVADFSSDIKNQTTVVYGPQSASDKYPGQMKVIATGKTETWPIGGSMGDITIEAPDGSGYVITTANNQRVYVSGDKECLVKVTAIKGIEKPILSVGKTTVSVPSLEAKEEVTCIKAK